MPALRRAAFVPRSSAGIPACNRRASLPGGVSTEQGILLEDTPAGNALAEGLGLLHRRMGHPTRTWPPRTISSEAWLNPVGRGRPTVAGKNACTTTRRVRSPESSAGIPACYRRASLPGGVSAEQGILLEDTPAGNAVAEGLGLLRRRLVVQLECGRHGRFLQRRGSTPAGEDAQR